jgi:hypothetical protein
LTNVDGVVTAKELGGGRVIEFNHGQPWPAKWKEVFGEVRAHVQFPSIEDGQVQKFLNLHRRFPQLSHLGNHYPSGLSPSKETAVAAGQLQMRGKTQAALDVYATGVKPGGLADVFGQEFTPVDDVDSFKQQLRSKPNGLQGILSGEVRGRANQTEYVHVVTWHGETYFYNSSNGIVELDPAEAIYGARNLKFLPTGKTPRVPARTQRQLSDVPAGKWLPTTFGEAFTQAMAIRVGETVVIDEGRNPLSGSRPQEQGGSGMWITRRMPTGWAVDRAVIGVGHQVLNQTDDLKAEAEKFANRTVFLRYSRKLDSSGVAQVHFPD